MKNLFDFFKEVFYSLKCYNESKPPSNDIGTVVNLLISGEEYFLSTDSRSFLRWNAPSCRGLMWWAECGKTGQECGKMGQERGNNGAFCVDCKCSVSNMVVVDIIIVQKIMFFVLYFTCPAACVLKIVTLLDLLDFSWCLLWECKKALI